MFVRCSLSDKSVASIAPSPPTPALCHHPAEDGRKEGAGMPMVSSGRRLERKLLCVFG